MVLNIKIDIIGAGFGGLSTAMSIKENNPSIDVNIYEKHNKIGYNLDGRRCGEAHDVRYEWAKWKPTNKSIYNVITKGEIYCGKNKFVQHVKNDTGFILNRPEFLSELSKKCLELGVTIHTNHKIKSIRDLDGRYIVDASGSRNQFKNELGIKKRSFGIAYQETLRNSNFFQADTIKLYYIGQNGYYWIFPRDKQFNEINIGVGFSHNEIKNLKELLTEFKKNNEITGDISYVTAGFIPGGLQPPYLKDNILFVGDTAVGAFPITGKGIYRALISGDMAGKCIANDQVNKYPYLIRNAFVSREYLMTYSIHRLMEIFRKINPDLVLKTLTRFMLISKSISKYQYEK